VEKSRPIKRAVTPPTRRSRAGTKKADKVTLTRAERELAMAGADAIKIIQSNPIPLVIIKSDRTILLANAAFYEKFHPTMATSVTAIATDGRLMASLGDGQWNIPALTAVVEKILSEGVEFRDFEISHQFPHIGLKVMVLNARRILLPGSGFEAALIAFDDVTERRQAESDRTEASSLLQQVSRRVPGLVYQYLLRPDGSSCFPFVSEGIRQIYQVAPQDVHEDGTKVLNLIHPDDREGVIASIKKSATDLSPWSLEYRVKYSDGLIRWLSGTGAAERREDGSVIWNGYVADITERKNSELALAQSEEKYRNLAASAYDGVMVVRRDGSIEFANDQIGKIFGYSPNELLNQQYEKLVADTDRKTLSTHHNRYLETPEQREMGKGLELVGRRKDGTEFPVGVSLSPFKIKGDVLVNCVIRDITNFKAIERERVEILAREKAARASAEKANQAKDDFLALLSHELRTPLTSILSWAQLLGSGKLDAEKANHGIRVLEQSAKAQGQLIDDLLDISRIQAGKLSLEIQRVDPVRVISAAVDSTRSLAASKSIQIESTISPLVKHVFADPTRLQQIVWNLITNSIKFSAQSGRIWITVDRFNSSVGERIRLQVRDNGKGIRPDFLPVMFERFTQVDSTNTRAYGGLGLGLAIVRKLVEMHEGTIEAESAGESQGATFTVSLPVRPSVKMTTAEDEARDEAGGEEGADVTLAGLRILLVEDDASSREVFAVILKSHEVRTAAAAREALEIFEELRPDILVSDIAMPDEDGYSLIGKIRALKSPLATIPALALTAYASREDSQRAYLAGFQSHVAKPVDGMKLALAIARLAGQR
jgi:PAS domain S-box-containing protein